MRESLDRSRAEGNFVLQWFDSLKRHTIKFAVNELKKNCFPSTPHETFTTQEVSLDGQEMTTPQDTIISAVIKGECNNGPRINLPIVIGLSAIVLLQTAGLVFLKRKNYLLNSKAKSNSISICLQNIPATITTATAPPDRQDAEAEEINELYEQTQVAGVDYCNTDFEQQYCEI